MILWPHITIDEINSLTEDEADMLLYIVNVWAPIRPPTPSEDNPHPVSLDLIRASNRHAIIDRIIQACTVVKEDGRDVYNGLRSKLGIPVPPQPPTPTQPEQKVELNNGPTTGSNVS